MHVTGISVDLLFPEYMWHVNYNGKIKKEKRILKYSQKLKVKKKKARGTMPQPHEAL